MRGPRCTSREAGGRVVHVDGSEHSTRSRFTIACAPELERELVRLVAQAVREAERLRG